MIKVIIALVLIVLMFALVMWSCLMVASDADDQMERWLEEDRKTTGGAE